MGMQGAPSLVDDTATPPEVSSLALVADDVELGDGVIIRAFTNLYGCRLGDRTQVGPFVEIQRGVVVGRLVKISSHSFLCEGVTIEDEVFIGHGVRFVNDAYPRATIDGRLQGADDWEVQQTVVKKRASLGSGAVVLGGLTVGEDAIVGAGSVVTKDVPRAVVVAGNPARVMRHLSKGDH